MTITLWCPCGATSTEVLAHGFLIALEECEACEEAPRPIPQSAEVWRASRAAASAERKGEDPQP